MLTQTELKAAFDGLPAVQKNALQAAAQRVRTYHEAQKKASGESWSYTDEDGTLLAKCRLRLCKTSFRRRLSFVLRGRCEHVAPQLAKRFFAQQAGRQMRP